MNEGEQPPLKTWDHIQANMRNKASTHSSFTLTCTPTHPLPVFIQLLILNEVRSRKSRMAVQTIRLNQLETHTLSLPSGKLYLNFWSLSISSAFSSSSSLVLREVSASSHSSLEGGKGTITLFKVESGLPGLLSLALPQASQVAFQSSGGSKPGSRSVADVTNPDSLSKEWDAEQAAFLFTSETNIYLCFCILSTSLASKSSSSFNLLEDSASGQGSLTEELR